MPLHIYIYMCTFMFMFMFILIFTFLFILMFVFVFISASTYTYICTFLRIGICVGVYHQEELAFTTLNGLNIFSRTAVPIAFATGSLLAGRECSRL